MNEKKKFDGILGIIFNDWTYPEEHSVVGSLGHFAEAFDSTAIGSNSVK